MAYTNRPFNYTGNLPNQVQNDLNLANDNFDILGQAFLDNNPETGIVKKSDQVDGYHASQTPQANTIPVAKSDGKIDVDWLPITKGEFYKLTFTTSNTWTVPNDVNIIWVTGTAGGGGGGGGWGDSSNYRGGGGGGSGSACVNAPIWVTPGETLSITIGSGGNGGSFNANGGNGGNTIISGSVSGTLLTLQEGQGGRGGYNASGGNGGGLGAGSGGAGLNSTPGGNGGMGSPFCLVGAGGGGGGDTGRSTSGQKGGLFFGRFAGGDGGSGIGSGGGGGASFFGAGGNGGNGGDNGSNGANGQGYGAGGGGGGGKLNDFYRGGKGASGYIEIIYFK